MKNEYFIGVDYSLSSPAITVLNDAREIVHVVHVLKRKRDKDVSLPFPNTQIVLDDSLTAIERFDSLASMMIAPLEQYEFTGACIEGYAYGGSGIVFDIAEATGIFKHMWWSRFSTPLEKVAPTELKKFATGKGNAKKPQMHEAWAVETEIDLYDPFMINSEKEPPSPINDIVDSYWLARFAMQKLI